MTTPASAGTPAIAGEALWQVFGNDAESHLKEALGRSETALEAAADVAARGLIPAVQDASFEVREGELFVIMGLSGSGKSTMVRCISRLVEPTRGSVLIDGEDILAASPKRLIELRRRKLGMVFQHFGLFPHMTVADNVAFPLKMLGKSKSERRARALEVIEMVGLDGREDSYPRQLSGGQKQRVGIARAIAQRPHIVLADEPVASLDPASSIRVLTLLRDVCRQDGIPAIISLHQLEYARQFADRIVGLSHGSIVYDGPPAGLTEDVLTKIYGPSR